MNQDIRQYVKLLMISLLYIALGIIGIYSSTLIFLVPLLMTPMAIYLMSSKRSYTRDIIMHMMISILIFGMTMRLDEALLYLISVAVPAHILVACYRKQYSVPHVAMYTGIGTVGLFYIYIIAMKYLQIDYIAMYNALLDAFKVEYIKMIEEMSQMTNMSEQMAVQIKVIKEQLPKIISLFKYTYPAMLLEAGIVIGLLSTAIITLIGRMKKWRMASLTQLVNFKFSKWMAGLFLIAGFIIQFSSGGNDSLTALGINLYYFISYLLQLIGIVALIMIIRKSKWSSGLKVISIVLSLMMFWTTPFIMMIIGLGDTLFNFRKVDIIV